ncbi:NAD kinase domain-containing protein 1-like, partial [Tropilaelaps mercedesae]
AAVPQVGAFERGAVFSWPLPWQICSAPAFSQQLDRHIGNVEVALTLRRQIRDRPTDRLTTDSAGAASRRAAPSPRLSPAGVRPSTGEPPTSVRSSVYGVGTLSASGVLPAKPLVYGQRSTAVAYIGLSASSASNVTSAAAVLTSSSTAATVSSCRRRRWCFSAGSRLQLSQLERQQPAFDDEVDEVKRRAIQDQPGRVWQGKIFRTSAEDISCETAAGGVPSRGELASGQCRAFGMAQLDGTDKSAGTKGADDDRHEPFAPKRVLVLTKFSRLEFEKRRHKDLSEEDLIRDLKARGSDYQSLLHHHNIHTKNRDLVVNTLRNAGLETRLVDRFDYTDANVEWADVIFTTGGDGTFLMAASKIRSRDKSVIGINSDPSRSVGYLCLPGHCTEDFPKALQKLLNGQFRWQWRQRIRVSVQGEHAFDPPLELHNQQLQYPEYRFIDCINEEHKPGTPATPTQIEAGAGTTDIPPVPAKPSTPVRILPIKSLNEVFIGESLSSRVSYYEISIDGSPRTKVKSSGVTICTGTGSTSWSFNISKVTPQCVKRILEIVQAKTGIEVGISDAKLIEEVTTEFNDSLIFDPSHARMAYTIRDPVFF